MDSFKGRVAEVQLWDRARSATEIAAYWARARTGTEPGLVGSFDFRAKQGTVSCDRLVRLVGNRCMSLERMITPFW